MDGCEVECVPPGCVWSRPRPEELKALNVIIRAVDKPSSNHTQITFTLMPTYTSHSRVVCVCVKEREKSTDGGKQRETKTRMH